MTKLIIAQYTLGTGAALLACWLAPDALLAQALCAVIGAVGATLTAWAYAT